MVRRNHLKQPRRQTNHESKSRRHLLSCSVAWYIVLPLDCAIGLHGAWKHRMTQCLDCWLTPAKAKSRTCFAEEEVPADKCELNYVAIATRRLPDEKPEPGKQL